VTSTYYLLLKRKIRTGENSIGDLNLKSPLFYEYITSSTSDLKENLEHVVSNYIFNFRRRHNLIDQLELQNQEFEKKSSEKKINNFNESPGEKNSIGKLSPEKIVQEKKVLEKIPSNSSRKNSANNFNKTPPSTGKKQWGKYKDIYVYKKSLKDTPQDKNNSNNKKLIQERETPDKTIIEFSTFDEKYEEPLETVTQTDQQTQGATSKNFEGDDCNYNYTPEKNLNKESVHTEISPQGQVLQTEPTRKNPTSKNKSIVEMNLDLNSGIIRNYLQSSKRSSIREEYDKYVKKSNNLETRKDILLTDVSGGEILNTENLQTIGNYNNPEKKKKIEKQIEKPSSSSKMIGIIKNDNHVDVQKPYKQQQKNEISNNKINSNQVSVKEAYKSKKFFLNTSVIPGRDESKSKNNSFDETISHPTKNFPEPKKISLTGLKNAIYENFSNNVKSNLDKKELGIDKILNFNQTKNDEKNLHSKPNKIPINPDHYQKVLKTEVNSLYTDTLSNNRLDTENTSPTIKKMKLNLLSFNRNNYLNNYPVQTTTGSIKETNHHNHSHIKGKIIIYIIFTTSPFSEAQ
jgi:hypothetical protein